MIYYLRKAGAPLRRKEIDMTLRGNFTNRLMEGQNFTDREIREGDDVTMYLYSDRHCYFVTKVIDQGHLFIHPYHVCADQSKEGGMGHQNWLYFKTVAEMGKYINSVRPDAGYDENARECGDTEIMLRRGKWKEVVRYNLDGLKAARELADRESSKGKASEGLVRFFFDRGRLTDNEMRKIKDGKEVVKYDSLSGQISFGVRDYHYDWEY